MRRVVDIVVWSCHSHLSSIEGSYVSNAKITTEVLLRIVLSSTPMVSELPRVLRIKTSGRHLLKPQDNGSADVYTSGLLGKMCHWTQP